LHKNEISPKITQKRKLNASGNLPLEPAFEMQKSAIAREYLKLIWAC
jgi:hypothetical protein